MGKSPSGWWGSSTLVDMRSAPRVTVTAGAVDVRQRFVALTVGVVAASAGGLVLASAEGTLIDLPGLLLLVPGAIALRGNVFGAVGSRLGTAVHTGTFRLSARPDGVVGQNMLGAAVLSLALSAALGVLARGTAAVFGIAPTMSLADFVVVSTLGGLLASMIVGVVTVGLAAGSVRFDWDLDNVMAPLVSTLGDLATVPALVVAALLADRAGLTDALGLGVVAAAFVVLVAAWRTPLDEVRRISDEFLAHESNKPYLTSVVLREKAERRITRSYQWIRNTVDEHDVAADIHLLASEETVEAYHDESGRLVASASGWSDLTRGRFQTHQAEGPHAQMLHYPYLDRNAELIREVLEHCGADKRVPRAPSGAGG